jgi:hypothetical protein
MNEGAMTMRTFDTPEPISVDVKVGVANLRLEATDRIDTTVEVRPTDSRKRSDVVAAEQTRVEYANGHLSIEAPSGWRQWISTRGDSIDVLIGLPAGSHLRGEGGVASLRGSGRLGEVSMKFGVGNVHLDEVGPIELKTGAGDVAIESADGRAQVRTGSGSLRIGRIDGPASVKNSNGDTWIGEVTGEARIGAANGRISIDRALEGVVAKTANGDVRMGEVARRTVVAQSAMGTIEVGVRDGVAAWLDLHTKFGQVQNDLADSAMPGTGEETVEVHASTSLGDIVLRRSAANRAGSDAS